MDAPVVMNNPEVRRVGAVLFREMISFVGSFVNFPYVVGWIVLVASNLIVLDKYGINVIAAVGQLPLVNRLILGTFDLNGGDLFGIYGWVATTVYLIGAIVHRLFGIPKPSLRLQTLGFTGLALASWIFLAVSLPRILAPGASGPALLMIVGSFYVAAIIGFVIGGKINIATGKIADWIAGLTQPKN